MFISQPVNFPITIINLFHVLFIAYFVIFFLVLLVSRFLAKDAYTIVKEGKIK